MIQFRSKNVREIKQFGIEESVVEDQVGQAANFRLPAFGDAAKMMYSLC